MEEKIYCKDLKKEIDTQTCHSHRKTLIGAIKKAEDDQKKEAREKAQICKKCPFNKSYPLIERVQMIYDNSPVFEFFQKSYEQDGNPITLFRAFTEAVRYKRAGVSVDIPEWVIEKLDEVFQKYLYDTFEKEEHRSLDRLFGCIRGKGQTPLREMSALEDRNFLLKTDIGMLVQLGIGSKDAAKIAYDYNAGSFSPNPERLRQTYQNRWKKQLEKVVDYGEPERIKDLLKSAPEEIKNKKKYLKIFCISSDKPDSPAKKKTTR